jgi:hypothetical protein
MQCRRNLAVQLQKVPSVVYGMFKYIHVIQHMKLVSNLRDMKQQMWKLHKKDGTCSTKRRDEKYVHKNIQFKNVNGRDNTGSVGVDKRMIVTWISNKQ